MTTTGPYELHLFACVNDYACLYDGAATEIRQWFKDQVKQHGMKDRVRANKALCFSQCGHGPLVCVYPENVWYAHLTLDDARRIWDEHVVGGRVVEDLVYEPATPGGNALPRKPAGRGELTMVDRSHERFRPCNRCPA
jgi:(2Fe-2S) ferredoxin